MLARDEKIKSVGNAERLFEYLFAHLANVTQFNKVVQTKRQNRLLNMHHELARNLLSLRDYLKHLRQHSPIVEDEVRYVQVIDLLRWLNS